MAQIVDPDRTERSSGTEDHKDDPWYSEHEHDPYREYFHEVERVRECKKAQRKEGWMKLFRPIQGILFSVLSILKIIRR